MQRIPSGSGETWTSQTNPSLDITPVPERRDAHGEGARSSGARSRLAWLDVSKGIAIILVVCGHAFGGVIDSSLPQGDWIPYAFITIYIFHMPLFFFLSGFLVVPRIERNASSFVMSLITKIAYPYFLWSIFQIVILWSAGSLLNTPMTNPSGSILRLPIAPVSQFWFLYSLFVLHLISFLLVRVAGALPLVGVSLLTMYLAKGSGLPVIAMVTIMSAPYYFLGAWVGGKKWIAADRVPSRGALALVAGVAIALLLLTTLWITHVEGAVAMQSDSAGRLQGISRDFRAMPAALLMILAVIAISLRHMGRLSDALAYLGRLAMPIYIFHIIIIAGLRIVFGKLVGGFADPIVPLLVIAGIGLPLIGYHLLDRLKLTKPLGLK